MLIANGKSVMIAKKHGTRVAMQPGVHPTMLALKRVALNPVRDLLFRAAEDYAFERVYLERVSAEPISPITLTMARQINARNAE
jgi:hypothetical protein